MLSDPKPERPDRRTTVSAEATARARALLLKLGYSDSRAALNAGMVALCIRHVEQAPLPAEVKYLANSLRGLCWVGGGHKSTPCTYCKAATTLETLARERDAADGLNEAAMRKLDQLEAELAALRERLEAVAAKASYIWQEIQRANGGLDMEPFMRLAHDQAAALERYARSAAQGDGEASDGD